MGDQLSLDELRAILSDEIHKIQDGETTASNVNAIVNATGKIFYSIKLQMEYYRITGKPLPDMPMLMPHDKPKKPKIVGESHPEEKSA